MRSDTHRRGPSQGRPRKSPRRRERYNNSIHGGPDLDDEGENAPATSLPEEGRDEEPGAAAQENEPADGAGDDAGDRDEGVADRPPQSTAPKTANDPRKCFTAADDYEDYARRLASRQTRAARAGLVGAATGLPQLDEATGGLQQLTILGGPTQSGKTSLALQFCLAAVRRDDRLVAVYLMMDNISCDDLFDQMICHEARVEYAAYVRGHLPGADETAVRRATARLQQEVWPRLAVVGRDHTRPHLGLDGARMFRFCSNFRAQAGADSVLVVVDMIDDMPLPRPRPDDCEEYLEHLRRIEADPDRWRRQQLLDLQQSSRQLSPGGWPILAVAKVRKSLARREEPSVEDLLGAAELGYVADRVFFLVGDPDADPSSPVVPTALIAKKCRRGRNIALPLTFHHTQFRFEEARGPAGAGPRAKKHPTKSGKQAASRNAGPAPAADPLAGMDP